MHLWDVYIAYFVDDLGYMIAGFMCLCWLQGF